MGKLLHWLAWLALAAPASAAILALLTRLLQTPGGDFWPRLSAYWLSRHAAPFWLSVLVLELAGALLAAPLTWPPARRELRAVPLGCFLAGVGYSGLRFLRQGLAGTPVLGQAAAFWPDVLGLALSLAAGAVVALAALSWIWPSAIGPKGRDSRRSRRT